MKYLIAGLGNMDKDYFGTRHNIGFEIVDALAAKFGLTWKLANHVHLTEFKHKGKTIILIKPTTYMNLSGKAIHYWIKKENIPIENTLVILDDLNLEFGLIRLKPSGSDGGHNGLKDISAQLATTKYPRLRIGIGNNFKKGLQINFVLGKWTKEEEKALIQIIDWCVEASLSFCLCGIGNTMNAFNSKKLE